MADSILPEMDAADPLEAMVNALNDSLSQETNSGVPDVLGGGVLPQSDLISSLAAELSQSAGQGTSVLTSLLGTSALPAHSPATAIQTSANSSLTTAPSAFQGPAMSQSQPAGVQVPATSQVSTSSQTTVPLHQSVTATASSHVTSAQSSSQTAVSSPQLSPATSSANPLLPQHMPIQVMKINGRDQPAMLMTISLASAKPDTVFAIPMAAALAGAQQQPAVSSTGSSTAASSVTTTMTSVNAERPPVISTPASSAAALPPSSNIFTPAGSTGVSASAGSVSNIGISSAVLAPQSTAAAATAGTLTVSTSPLLSSSLPDNLALPSHTAVAAAAQATAAAAAVAPQASMGRKLSIDSLSEPARKKKKKAAIDALPKPLSPYQCFFREIQSEVRRQNPKASFAELSMMVNSMWESMPESSQEVYNAQARQSTNEYEQAVKAIQGTSPTNTNGASTAGFYAIAEPETTPGGKPRGRNRKIAPNKCLNEECMSLPQAAGHRGNLYCSDKCSVTHCQIAFKNWVTERRKVP
ncbi:TOX high mobility group box family member 4-like isoform X2 [Sycon ciliatum]|uniref:TOX high mobility group box family member 4-like isoform X2 n=1 Tax=Sycon ciliatum TaxID=27933 RepID=UPI0031F63CFA